jgi:dolichol-phosphate mannosyltransferase
MKAVIVIPTYNESGTIGQMIDYLCTKTLPNIKNWQLDILVVDGNSPDGTGKIVTQKSNKFKNVHLYKETSKDGIGAAYLKGFKYSMEVLHADVVLEFDGDFQHPPEAIAPMLKAIDAGFDYVIGSRKVAGGSNPSGWGFKRLFFSEVGGFVARFIMFFPFKNFFQVTDPTTGLKATRIKGYLDHLNLDFNHLYTRSFGYKLQLLYETLALGAKFTEVPLQFGVRTTGESKIEPQTAKDIFLVALKMRWFDEFTQKFLKFGVVGGVGFFINFFGLRFFNGVYKQFSWPIGMVNFLANATAAEISIVSNFIFNNLWTFSQEKITRVGQYISKFIAFNLSSIIGGIIVPSIVIGIGTQIFGDNYRELFLVLALFTFTIPFNWFVYSRVIWRKK